MSTSWSCSYERPRPKLCATNELPVLAPSIEEGPGQIGAIPIEGTVFWLMLDGGPCAGGYRTQRAPANLKAVRVPPGGKPDVLDLPDDQARDDEEIYLYERASAQSEGIVCVRGSGCGHIVLYRYVRPLRGQLTLLAPDGRATFPRSSPGAAASSADPICSTHHPIRSALRSRGLAS
jgi:hypothetical protein